jgi:hypothetical protein
MREPARLGKDTARRDYGEDCLPSGTVGELTDVTD